MGWLKQLFIFLTLASCACAGEKWMTFKNCQLVDDKYFDGDSFHVKAPTGYTYVFRLYGVDCPETDDLVPARITEQSKAFGIPEKDVLRWGKRAKTFTHKFLSKPFTVITCKAKAGGRSSQNRYYAIILNAQGERLDEALVKAGLARAHGVGAAWPERMKPERYSRKLTTLEHAAKRDRAGIWRK